MKKRRRRLKKQISVGITVFCLIAAGCLAMLLTPLFNVGAITVTGNRTIATEDIVKGSGIVKGKNIFSISLTAAQERLSYMNGIDTVKIRRSLPSTIRITITEGNPLVYVENEGSFVGITADGKVVDVAEAGSAAAMVFSAGDPIPSEKPAKDAGGEYNENNDEDNDAFDGDEEESSGEEAPTKEPSSGGTTSARTVVYGMGAFTYSSGKKIEFEDRTKSEKLFLLMSEFLGDDICRGFTQIDMSAYDNINLVYQGRLKVCLGSAQRLDYKLKCFKKLISENLGENPSGTLDLEHLIYNPKK